MAATRPKREPTSLPACSTPRSSAKIPRGLGITPAYRPMRRRLSNPSLRRRCSGIRQDGQDQQNDRLLVGLLLIGISAVVVATGGWKSHIFPNGSGVPSALGFALYIPQFFGTQPIRVAHGGLVTAGCLWIAASLWQPGAPESLRPAGCPDCGACSRARLTAAPPPASAHPSLSARGWDRTCSARRH